MAGLGAPELMIVLVIILVIFGGAKLPKLAKSLGEARREFEKANDEAAKPAVTATTDPAEQTVNEARLDADARVAAAEREAELARREADLLRREAEVRDRENH